MSGNTFSKVLGVALACLLMASTLGTLPSTVNATRLGADYRPPTPTLASPAGQGKIAFHRSVDGSSEIAVINPDGSGLASLSQQASGPAWSPDGTKIAFVSQRDGNEEIYVMNADGTGVTRITDSPEWEMDPAWSPDSTKIAFARVPPLWQQPADVWIMNVDGSGQVQLTDHPDEDRMPSWSPDGTKIAFVSYRGGYQDIWVMNADGSSPTNLINDSDWDFGDNEPVWSPDGGKIAFAADREKRGGQDIYVMGPDGSNIARLTTPIGQNHSPSWSPDGTRIAFASNRDGNYEIYIMNADGTSETRVTTDPVNESGPSWGIAADTGVIEEEPDIRTPIGSANFGNVTLGSSLDKTTTIYNEGNASLTINSITRTAGGSDFTYISPSTPFNVGAGGSKTVTVRFGPSSEGAKNAIFTIASNDPDEASVTFAVSGTGTKKKPPTAYLDSVSPNPGIQDKDTISFAGHGTDPDGSVAAYNWRSSLDGQLSTSSSFSMLASELSIGTHTIYFKVQDNDGLWSPEVFQDLTITQEHTVTIVTGPEAEPPTVDSSGIAQLSVSATDSLDHAISYEWTATGGSFDNAKLQNPAWHAPLNTTNSIVYYTLTVTVTCTAGKTAVGDVQVGVKPEEKLTVSIDGHSAKPQEVKVDESTTLSFNFTNIGNIPWTFYAAISLRKPDGEEVPLPLKPVFLQPGQQGGAAWSYSVDMEGGWDVVFGIWKEQKQINSLGHTGWLDGYVVGVPPPSVGQFTLSISHNANGTVTASLSGEDPAGRPRMVLSSETGEVKEYLHYYEAATEVTLTAEPDPGYRFSHWGGDLAGSKNPGTLTVESDVQVIAYFVPESLIGVVQVANLEGDELALLGRVMRETIDWVSTRETDSAHKGSLTQAKKLAAKIQPGDNVHHVVIEAGEEAVRESGLLELANIMGQWGQLAKLAGLISGPIGLVAQFTGELAQIANYLTPRLYEKLALDEWATLEVDELGMGNIYMFYEKEAAKITVHVDLFDPPGRILMVIPLKPILADSGSIGNVVLLKEMVPDFDRLWLDYPEVHVTKIIVKSPVELRVYDSERRVTGIVNGQVREEIPSSSYSEDVVVILSPTELPLDTYDYEIQGTGRGTYGLEVKSVRGEATNDVSRANVAISAGAVHQYDIDWGTLAEGGKGVTMRIDADGDGVFEETKHFSQEEGGFPWVWIVVAGLSALVGVLVGAFMVRRRMGKKQAA